MLYFFKIEFSWHPVKYEFMKYVSLIKAIQETDRLLLKKVSDDSIWPNIFYTKQLRAEEDLFGLCLRLKTVLHKSFKFPCSDY